MPAPRDRLDLLLVPADPHRGPDPAALTALLDAWQSRGWLAAGAGPLRRTPGPRADALVPGGFEALWADLPGVPTLYANELGGVRVACGACGRPLARELGRALLAWRAGGDPTLACPRCGAARPVWTQPLAPPGAFAWGALVVAGLRGRGPEALAPTAPARAELEAALGPLVEVLRRPA